MKHLASRELYAYWDRLRGERTAPERRDIDPGAIRPLLADLFVAEVKGTPLDGGRDLRIRLAGSRVEALFGGSAERRDLLRSWRADHRGAYADVLDTLLDAQSPVVVGVGATVGRETARLELLLLPLRHNGRTHDRVLGTVTPAGAAPWLGRHPIEDLTVDTFRRVMARPPRPGIRSVRPGSRTDPTRHGRFLVYEGGRFG